MTNSPTPRLVLAAVAVLGLYVPTLGLPLPGSCLRTGAAASAAPSPSCSSDLRECLRSNARETVYGARYVTADDVSHCVDAFKSCIHGGASRGGNSAPPASTPGGGGGGRNKESMPQRFKIDGEDFDCTTSGGSFTCTAPPQTNSQGGTSTRSLSGSMSGRTASATRTDHFVGPSVNGCVSTVDYSWQETYEFKPDGTGFLRRAPGQWDQTLSGSCSGTHSGPVEGAEGPLTWSPIG